MKKVAPTVALAVFFGLAAAFLVYFTLAASRPNVPVVVALGNLSVGHVISQDDLIIRKYPPFSVPDGALRSTAEAVGKTVTYGPVLAGDVVRAQHLSPFSSLAASLEAYAPRGWVAVELPEGTGMGMTGIRRGDSVDIYADMPAAQGRATALAVRGAVLLATPFMKDNDSKSYVVAVPPESAPILAEIDIRGKRASLVLVQRGEEK